MQKRLNVKLIVALVLAAGLLAVGFKLRHREAVKQNKGSLLSRAQAAVKANNYEEAALLYNRYLIYDQQDAKAWAALADTLVNWFEKEPSSKSFSLAYQSLTRGQIQMPEGPEKRKLTRVLTEEFLMHPAIHRYDDAIENLDSLLNTADEKEKPELEVLLASALAGDGKYEEAMSKVSGILGYDQATQEFDESKATSGRQISAYTLLVYLLERKEENEAAAKVMDRLVTANPDSAEAFLRRGLLHYSSASVATTTETNTAEGGSPVKRDYSKAEADLRHALELDPKNRQAALVLADILASDFRYDDALELLEKLKAESPKEPSIHRHIAAVWSTRSRQLQGAEQKDAQLKSLQALEDGLAVDPDNEDLLFFKVDQLLLLSNVEEDAKLQGELLTGAKEAHGKLSRAATAAPFRVRYLESRIKLAEDQPRAAARILEQIRSEAPPLFQPQIDLARGEAYLALGDYDRAKEASRSVLAVRPDDPGAKMILASLQYRQTGGEAVKNLQGVVDTLKKSSANDMVIDRVTEQLTNRQLQEAVREQIAKPEDRRDWTQVDNLAKQVFKGYSKEQVAEKQILQAEINGMKGNHKNAEKYFKQARETSPEKAIVWYASAKHAAMRLKDFAAAEALVDEGLKASGDSPSLLGLKIALIAENEKPIAEKAKEIEALAPRFKDFERRTRQSLLLTGGAILADRFKDYAGAERLMIQSRDANPDSFDAHFALLQLYMQSGGEENPEEVDKIKEAANVIKQHFGEDSAEWMYAECEYLVAKYRQASRKDPNADKKPLVDARNLLTAAQLKRGQWDLLARMSGVIDQLSGNLAGAADSLQDALDQNPSDLVAARRLFAIHIQQQNLTQAKVLAVKMLNQDQPREVMRLMAEVLESQGDRANAILAAEKLCASENALPIDRAWFGTMFDRMAARAKQDGRPDLAEEHYKSAELQYRKAIEADPTNVDSQLALVQHFRIADQVAKIADAEKEAISKIDPKRVPFFRAQAAELASRLEDAEKYYKAAATEEPDNTRVVRGYAAYLLRTPGKTAAAIPLLDKLIALGPDQGKNDYYWARVAKSEALAADGDYQMFLQAVKLLEEGPEFPREQQLEVSLRLAAMLARRDEPSAWKKGLQIFQKLGSDRRLMPEENINYASLLLKTGDAVNAKAILFDALSRMPAQNPGFEKACELYIDMLAKEGDYSQAEVWVQKLSDIRQFFVRAKLLAKQGKKTETAEMVEKLKKAITKPEEMRDVAFLLEQLELYQDAETAFDAYVKMDKRAALIQVAFLARRGNVDEALDRIDTLMRAAKKVLPQLVEPAHNTLTMNRQKVTPEQIAKVEGWLNVLIQENPDLPSLQVKLAEIRGLQGRQDEVTAIYEKLLNRKDLDNVLRALIYNNLAYNLAVLDNQGDRGLELINEAINILGPRAYLLDTRSLAYVAKKDYPKALAEMREAAFGSQDPLLLFHLAWVEKLAGEKDASIDHYRRAKSLNINENSLTPPEKEWITQLEKMLEEAPAGESLAAAK